jgi:anthranilate synthase component 1
MAGADLACDPAAALAAGRPALVWRRQIADTETPVAAALKLIEPGRGDFLLESVEGGAIRGRHSLIGLAPDLVFRAQGNAAEVNSRWLSDRDAFTPCEAPTLEALRHLVADCRMDVPPELPRALACLVGYFGYETVYRT